jgi:hypothetical protein
MPPLDTITDLTILAALAAAVIAISLELLARFYPATEAR